MQSKGLIIIVILISILSGQVHSGFSPANELTAIEDRLKLAQTYESQFAYEHVQADLANFIKKYKADLDSSPSLQKQWGRLNTLNRIQAGLHKCLKILRNPSGAARRILSLAQSFDADQFDNCLSYSNSPTRPLMQIIQHTDEQLYQEFYNQTQINSAINLAEMNYRLNSDYTNKYKENIQKDAVKAVCTESSDSCTSEQRNKIEEAVKDRLNSLVASGIERETPQIAAQNLKGKINRINLNKSFSILENNEVVAEQEAQKKYRAYVTEYWALSSDGLGQLLNAPSLEKKVKSPPAYSGVQKTNDKMYSLKDVPNHVSDITEADIKNAYSEYRAELGKALQEYREPLKNDKISAADLQEKMGDFVDANPLAVAQILVKNPEATDSVCRSIQAWETSDKKKKDFRRLRQTALGVTGGVLVAGGIVVTAASLGLGSAVGTPLVYAGSALSGAGAVLSAGEVAGSVYDYYESKNYVKQLAKAQMAGNADLNSEFGIIESEEKMNEAMFNAGLSLGAAGVGAVASQAFRMTKYFPKRRITSEILQKEIQETEPLLANIKSKIPEADYNELRGKLIGLPPSERAAVMKELKKLEGSNFRPMEVIRVNRAIDKALSKCGKGIKVPVQLGS